MGWMKVQRCLVGNADEYIYMLGINAEIWLSVIILCCILGRPAKVKALNMYNLFGAYE